MTEQLKTSEPVYLHDHKTSLESQRLAYNSIAGDCSRDKCSSALGRSFPIARSRWASPSKQREGGLAPRMVIDVRSGVTAGDQPSTHFHSPKILTTSYRSTYGIDLECIPATLKGVPRCRGGSRPVTGSVNLRALLTV